VEGADRLDGAAGNDDIYGDEGDDFLDGGAGEDALDGGYGGVDTCINGETAKDCETLPT
jgi:Ca2+-binding RTX toxin-like protein